MCKCRDAIDTIEVIVFDRVWRIEVFGASKSSNATAFPRIQVMSTDQIISPSECCAIETIHKATLQDLLKNMNMAVWHLLIERNQTLHER